MADGTMLTDTLLGYSGLLYNKGNDSTPLLNAMAGRDEIVQHREFVLSQDYEIGAGEIPQISEQASINGASPKFITRNQNTNITMIFQEALAISYRKESDVNTLNGLNLAGATANPLNELDFQINGAMSRIAKQVENTIINSKYNKAIDSSKVDSTRGLLEAITTNTIDMGGTGKLDVWAVNDALQKRASNGATTDVVLVVDGVGLNQINGSAIEQGLTVMPMSRNDYGIKVEHIIAPFGDVSILLDINVPAGTALLVDLDALHLVHQPVPGKGNFFVEKKGTIGASEQYQIYGQLGLDYTNELLHAKITGLDTTFTKPTGLKVVTVAQA